MSLVKRLIGPESDSHAGSTIRVSSRIASGQNSPSSTRETTRMSLGRLTAEATGPEQDAFHSGDCGNRRDACAAHAAYGPAIGHFTETTDQRVYDSLWASYLDESVDIDLLLHDGSRW